MPPLSTSKGRIRIVGSPVDDLLEVSEGVGIRTNPIPVEVLWLVAGNDVVKSLGGGMSDERGDIVAHRGALGGREVAVLGRRIRIAVCGVPCRFVA